MNPLSFLGSTGSFIASGVLVLGTLGSITLWFHEHDKRIASDLAAQQAVIVAQAQHDQDVRTMDGLAKTAAQATARANSLATLKEAISHAPRTNACASSPAIRALIGGLRRPADSGHAGPASATTP